MRHSCSSQFIYSATYAELPERLIEVALEDIQTLFGSR